MPYIEAKIHRETRKTKIANDTSVQKEGINQHEQHEQLTISESEAIEINIPGLQIEDGSEDHDFGNDQCELPCAICQSDYEQDDSVMILPCNHFYHQNCIGTLRANGKNEMILHITGKQ